MAGDVSAQVVKKGIPHEERKDVSLVHDGELDVVNGLPLFDVGVNQLGDDEELVLTVSLPEEGLPPATYDPT